MAVRALRICWRSSSAAIPSCRPYEADPPYNCFPSLHVAPSFVSALACSRLGRGLGAASLSAALLVQVSTLFTKQYYVVAVAAGVLLAGVAFLVFLRRYPPASASSDRRVTAVLAAGLAVVIGAGADQRRCRRRCLPMTQMRWFIVALAAAIVAAVGIGLLLPRLLMPPAAPANRVNGLYVGGLYSVDNSDGGFRIAKVLAVDADVIHVRLYGNHFSERPSKIDSSALTLLPDAGYDGPGFARIAVTPRFFVEWRPRLIQATEPPSAEELQGSDRWSEDPGPILGRQ